MTIAISAPTGFLTRELLLPLKPYLDDDETVKRVVVITPAAPWARELFAAYGSKYAFEVNPDTHENHLALLRQHRPQVVVTTTAGLDPLDTPILNAAHELAIPTVTFISSWDNVWKMQRREQHGAPCVLARHLIVWNTMMRDHLLRLYPSLPPSAISVIGAPRLDYFSHHDKIPPRGTLLTSWGLPVDDRALVHLATTELYPMDYIVAALARAQARRQLVRPIRVVLTVHPGGTIARHRAYATAHGAKVLYSPGRRAAAHPDFAYNPTVEDLYQHVALFRHSAVLITHSSTVAVESLLADVPVINVNYGRPFDWWRWRRSMVRRDFTEHYRDLLRTGATSVVTSASELMAALNRYLGAPATHREARGQAIRQLITTVDGTAAAKVYTVIRSAAV